MVVLESGWDGNLADGVLPACCLSFPFEAARCFWSIIAGPWASWEGLVTWLLFVGEREVQESMTCSITLELLPYLSAVGGELRLDAESILGSA